jgi:hypothetical protein
MKYLIKNNYILRGAVLSVLLLAFSSCFKDLNVEPLDDDLVTSASVYKDPAAYKQVLAKIYGGLALTGNQGPAGNADVAGVGEGESQYLRMLFYLNELTTDEAVVGWADNTIKNFHWMNWTSSDIFISGMYYRIFYQIVLCNEYLRETTDAKLDERGIDATTKANVQAYRAEVRYMRALSYWHALDLFETVPFVTEDDPIGAFNPTQISKQDLFNYIESELLAIDADLVAPRQNDYARADKAAAWMVLAKLYLNAEVYIGTPKYTECITYCKKIIDAGYSLDAKYSYLFLADNNLSSEVIFPVAFDGIRTQGYGGTTFLINASLGGSMNYADFGMSGGWGGLRTTKEFVGKFADITGNTDERAQFHTAGQSLVINDIGSFSNGYAVKKFRNVTRDGDPGSNGSFPDTDFPMFRLADAYLMYAEAVKRGGSGGDEATALGYLNAIRTRAYGDTSGNITSYDLNYIIDERARELYWENHRRTDLRRFGLFTTGSYLWQWKGNAKDGVAVDDCRNVFPLPSSDLTANPLLQQNRSCY